METFNTQNIYEKISVLVVTALAFLMPVFFLTTTTEFYEFNKLALLGLACLVLLATLAVKVVNRLPINIVKSELDLPILGMLLVAALSTLFSIDKVSSIWGSQGRWFPGLFGIATMTLFYYLAAQNFKKAEDIKRVILSLVTGTTLATITAILSYYEIFFGNEPYLKNTSFTLTGSTTTTFMLAIVTTILAVNLVYREKNMLVKTFLNLAIFINFFYVTMVNNVSGWVLFAVGLMLCIKTLGTKRIIEDRMSTMFLSTILVTVFLLGAFTATRSIIFPTAYPNEIKLSIKDSWRVAASTIQDYPMLATGPSTFYMVFSKYRPLTLNATTSWNVKFDKPYNEILNVIASLGIIGLGVFIFLIVKIVKFALSNKASTDNEGVMSSLIIGSILLSGVYFVTYATVLNTFMLFLFIAMLAAAHVHLFDGRKRGENVVLSFASISAVTTTIGETSAIRKEYANLVLISPLVALALFGAYLFSKTYLAEFYMRKAISAALSNKATVAYDYQGKAINTFPRRDVYQTAYAQTNLVLANALAANKNLTDQDKQNIQTLISQSIRSTRLATEALNPQNVANWETRALVYRSLVNVADNAADWAINAYNTSITLDPSNPTLRVDLGSIYYIKKDYLSAANMFRQAAVLKNDYANAHYNFAQALLSLKDIENAKRELETTKTLVPQDSNDFNLVQQQISALNSQQPAVAGATTEKKPTVEEISGTTTQQKPTVQEPLSNPTEQPASTNLSPKAIPQATVTPTTTPTPTPSTSPSR